MGVVVPVSSGYLSMPYNFSEIEYCISKSERSVVLPMTYFEAYRIFQLDIYPRCIKVEPE